ncbi:hypothetical protein EV175_004780 [Coemansia sp. RSA 1933]|nr:hypothetical protein EV175_004780 [Coemansia sp. RSA 1933]
MVHEELLNAYIFDFLKKKGYLQTALLFADECKNLPLAETTSNDPLVSVPPGFSFKSDTLLAEAAAAVTASSTQQKDIASKSAGDKNANAAGGLDTKGSLSPSSTLPTCASTTATAAGATDNAGGESRSVTASPQTQHRVPSVNIPINTPQGFLSEWWSIFWDVFASTSERRPGAPIADNIREYVLYQNQKGSRRPSNVETLNINGKRFQSHVGTDMGDAIQGTKKTRMNMGDRSPQSAALVAKYSFADDAEHIRTGSDQQAAMHVDGQRNGLSTNGVPTIPRGPGVNISLAGAHVLSEDYPGFLSRSLKMVAENYSAPSSSSSMFAGVQASSSASIDGTKAVAAEDNQPGSGLSEVGATGAARPKDNSSESPMSHHGNSNQTGQITGNRQNSATFASPYISNAPVPRPVPTQQHVGMQQPINSPLIHSSTASTSASNIQMMQRLISPPPASYSGAYPKQSTMGSPIVSNAPAGQPDLRRASTASVVYRTPQQMQQQQQQVHQQQQQQQQQNPNAMVSEGALQRIGSTGPQVGPAQRQQQLVPSNLGPGMGGNQGVPGGAGVNPAELGFPNNPAAAAAAAAAMAAAAANQGVNFNGRNPTQAMMAYLQQQQQYHQQQQQQLQSNMPSSVPSNDTIAGNRQPPPPPQHVQAQPMNMQMHAAQFGHQFIPVAGMAMGAAEHNPGMVQDPNQRNMLQLQMQMQMQQGSNNPQGMSPASGSGGPGNQGSNVSPAQKAGDSVTGIPSDKGSVGSNPMASVARMNAAGSIVSPQMIPQQGSPIGAASAGPTKKTATKPKTKRTGKKSSAKSALATTSSTSVSNALAKSHPAPGNSDSMIAAHQRGVSVIPVNAALGNNGQPNGNSSSAGSSIVNSSPALAIKASSTPAVSGINIPAANNISAVPNTSMGGPFALGMNGRAESEAQNGGGSIPGFGDNTFSALLSQKGNRMAMQANSGGGGGGGHNGSGGEIDLSSAMSALGGGMDANELSMQLSEWLNDSSADALTNILSMGVSMGAGAGDVGGDHGNAGMGDPAAAFSFLSNGGNGGVGGNGGGFSSALGMPSSAAASMGSGVNNGAMGGAPVSSGGGGSGGKVGEASMVFSSPTAPGTKNM